jgi:inosose dehydratase
MWWTEAMKDHAFPRRSFLREAGLACAAFMGTRALHTAVAAAAGKLHLASNSYSWHVFYQREGRNFGATLDEGLKDVAASGLNGYEPGIGGPGDFASLTPLLQKHGLGLRSIYVNSTLHTEADAAKSLENIVAIGKAAKAAGTRIVVTNPNPLRWGGPENKDDGQLTIQADAMNQLGRKLGELGLTLAYHNHDIELRQGAREFHHMMAGTDPRYVSLCLDAHWVYRGCGNSSVALFDVVKLYGGRVSELHLRQSDKGVWSETLGPGDIDYEALAEALARHKARPHLVLEVAVENGTPKTLSPVEAHRRSVEYAQRVFAKLR